MADNFNVTSSGSTTVATKDIGGVHHAKQLMEFDVGGTPTLVSSSAPLPVVQTGTPALPTGAATAAKQPALGTAGTASTDVITIQGIASMTKILVTPDANSSVNFTQIAGNSVSTGNGVVGTGVQRVAIASDNTAFAVNATLQAGTNGIGKLTANSGVDIGDVDVTTCGTITPGTGATNLGKAEDAAHITGDVGVLALIRRADAPSSSATSDADYATLNANANGQLYTVLSDTIQISVTPTVSTTPAYTAKDAIGGKQTFANAARFSAGSGVVTGVTVVDQAAQGQAMDLVLFYTDPTGTTVTDNAALDIADADVDKIFAVIPIIGWSTFNDNAICTVNNLYCPFVAGATSIYGALVARGTPTFAATADIVVKLTIQRD